MDTKIIQNQEDFSVYGLNKTRHKPFEESCVHHFPIEHEANFPSICYGADHIDFFGLPLDMLKLYSKKKYGWQEICEILLRLILTRAFVRLKQELPHPTEISQISSRLDSFLPGKSMEELARACGLSRSAFFMNFRKQFGCSPLTYRNNILLTRAKAFLRTTDLKIKEISDILNFQNPYYFTNFFIKHMHLSPTEYREKMSSKDMQCCSKENTV